jgi:hypothetical protein
VCSEEAAEVCDGADNDCNGVVDDENATGCIPFFLDQDGDGYGMSNAMKCLCTSNGDYDASKGGDCDDDVYNVHPTVVEFCDGLDNNCNGEIDEGAMSCGSVAHGKTACAGGCIIDSCDSEFFDMDSMYANGCECQSDDSEAPGQVCADATFVGSLSDAGQSKTMQGKLVPENDADWYMFTAFNDGGVPDDEHFIVRILMTQNPGFKYRMEVYDGSCGGASQICIQSTQFLSTVTPPVGESHSYYVRVGYASGGDVGCMPYVLEFSNGIYVESIPGLGQQSSKCQ